MTTPQRTLAGATGFVALLVAWEIAGRLQLGGSSLPPVSIVAAYFSSAAHRALLGAAVAQTAREAALGYACGALGGCALAALVTLVPPLAPGIERLAATLNAIPILAVGSLCAVTFPATANPSIVAALGTFFMLFIAFSAGMSTASATRRALFAALGASRGTTFVRLLVPSAFPALVDGLRLAAPVAVVGAIIGEWFSGERGLGPMLVNAMQNYQVPLLWAAACLGTLLSALAYGALAFVQRFAIERFR